MDYQRHLDIATTAALRAGALLVEEFHRPGGPRGAPGHCPADMEAETIIRDIIDAEYPNHGIIAEELGPS